MAVQTIDTAHSACKVAEVQNKTMSLDDQYCSFLSQQFYNLSDSASFPQWLTYSTSHYALLRKIVVRTRAICLSSYEDLGDFHFTGETFLLFCASLAAS